MRKRSLTASLAAAAGVLSSGLALAAPTAPTVLFSNLAASPTSDVPGIPGAKFNPGTTSLAAFDRPYLSPDGNRWIIGTIIDGATDLDAVVTGTGFTTAGASTPVKEGDATPDDPNAVFGAIKTSMGVNNAGQFAFAADTTAPTTADDVIVRWTGTAFEVIAREGTQAPGQPVGNGYGSTNDAAHILNNGDVRFRSAALTGNTTQQVLYSNSANTVGTVVAQTDTTIPTNQMVLPDQTLDVFGTDRFASDATGANYLYGGDLNGPTTTDLVVVHNGAVVAQEGFPLPGWSNTAAVVNFSSDLGSQVISKANDHFMFRGAVNDGTGAAAQTDFVVRDGAVVAATGQPIFAGATELFDDTAFTATFFLNAVNDNGDFVIGGTTNSGNVNDDAVLVYNNSFAFLREGSPVDLDGDGLFDDNTFIDVFGNDDGVLTNDGRFYLVATLQDGANVSIGQALIVVQVPEPGALSLLGIGAVGLLRRRRAG